MLTTRAFGGSLRGSRSFAIWSSSRRHGASGERGIRAPPVRPPLRPGLLEGTERSRRPRPRSVHGPGRGPNLGRARARRRRRGGARKLLREVLEGCGAEVRERAPRRKREVREWYSFQIVSDIDRRGGWLS